MMAIVYERWWRSMLQIKELRCFAELAETADEEAALEILLALRNRLFELLAAPCL